MILSSMTYLPSVSKLRIYGMSYFDESARYWGDKVEKVIGAGSGTLTARSVKIFADGIVNLYAK